MSGPNRGQTGSGAIRKLFGGCPEGISEENWGTKTEIGKSRRNCEKIKNEKHNF